MKTAATAAVGVVVALAVIGLYMFSSTSMLSPQQGNTQGNLGTTTAGGLGGGGSTTSAGGASPSAGGSGATTGTTTQQSGTSATGGASATSTGAPGSSTGASLATGSMSFYLTDAPARNQTLKYLLVNVSSIELRYEGNLSTSSATTSTSTSSTTSTSSSSTTSSATSSSTSTTTTSTSTTATTSHVSTTTARGANATAPKNVFVFNVPASVGRNVNLTSLHGQGVLLGAIQVPAGNVTAIVVNITGAKAFYTDGTSQQLKVVADGKLMIPIRFSIQPNGTNTLTIDIQPSLVHISQGGVLTPVVHVTSTETGRNGSKTTHTADTDTASTTATSTTT